jgi:hypothetical protein
MNVKKFSYIEMFLSVALGKNYLVIIFLQSNHIILAWFVVTNLYVMSIGCESCEVGGFEFLAPTTRRNALRVLRAMQLPKPGLVSFLFDQILPVDVLEYFVFAFSVDLFFPSFIGR